LADFFSTRFGKDVLVTIHAQHSMSMRKVDDKALQHLIEHGTIKRKDQRRMWIYMKFDDRNDNLVCAAAVEEDAVIVKTIMINWELEEN
jgi:hypothetical protein